MRKLLGAILVLGLFPACTSSDPEASRKAVGPTSELDPKPWNTPVPGQGGGVLGMLPQQARR